MKKYLLTLSLLLILPANAANWIEYGHKSYIDVSNWQQNGNIITAWIKELNPGDWQPLKNEKVWYRMSRLQADCGARKTKTLDYAIYNTKGNALDSYSFSDPTWSVVFPDTRGEAEYEAMCLLPYYLNN